MELKELDYSYFEKVVEYDKFNFPNDCWNIEDWKNLLNDKECHYYAYMVDDSIVANIFIAENPDGYIKIMNLAVAKKFRGKGLAVELLNYISKKYEKKGFLRYYGETRESNVAMRKSFEKSGYVFRSIVENMYDNPQENGIKYQLILDKEA